MRYIKIILWILLLIIAIAALAAACLVWFVNPNKLKPVLINEAMKAGYHIQIDGDLRWTFYPTVLITVPHMTVQTVGQTGTFVDFTDLGLGTQLAQLWQRGNRLYGRIYIGSVRFGKFRAQRVNGQGTWENNILTVDEIGADAYSGYLSGTLTGANFKTTPQWNWNIKLNNFNLQPLLMDLAPENKINISGSGQINFEGATNGKDRETLYNNLDAKLNFGFNNGVIDGMDLNYVVRTVDALLNKGDMPQANGAQTAYENLTGSVFIKDGIAQSDDLMLISPSFVTKGTGVLRLLSRQIKLDLLIRPQQDIRTQWEIPLNIRGTLDQPEVSLDRDQVAKFLAKEQLQKVKDKAGSLIEKFLNR